MTTYTLPHLVAAFLEGERAGLSPKYTAGDCPYGSEKPDHRAAWIAGFSAGFPHRKKSFPTYGKSLAKPARNKQV